MAEWVWAIYENQVLRLLEPLDLQDGQRVRIQVLEVEMEGGVRAIREEQPAYAVAAAQESDVGQQAHDSTAAVEDSIDALLRRLVKEGRMRPRSPGPIPAPPLSEEELASLADKLGRVPGKTASEMVIEDRGER